MNTKRFVLSIFVGFVALFSTSNAAVFMIQCNPSVRDAFAAYVQEKIKPENADLATCIEKALPKEGKWCGYYVHDKLETGENVHASLITAPVAVTIFVSPKKHGKKRFDAMIFATTLTSGELSPSLEKTKTYNKLLPHMHFFTVRKKANTGITHVTSKKVRGYNQLVATLKTNGLSAAETYLDQCAIRYNGIRTGFIAGFLSCDALWLCSGIIMVALAA